MCGILLLHGPAARARLPACLERLRHRGPDGASSWCKGLTALGFQRLAINDKGPGGQQPFEHGELIGAFNGEIYNHLELNSLHHLAVEGTCDTRVVLPLFAQLSTAIIHQLDGFYAGVILNQATGELFCFRDHIGKKPLLVGGSGSELFVTSELKAMDSVDWFRVLPRGASRVHLSTGEIELIEAHQDPGHRAPLAALVRGAITKRLPRHDEPLGLFLSGGLDSSIIAALVSEHRPDTIHYTLTDDSSPDRPFMNQMVDAFGLRHVRSVPLPDASELPALIEAVVRSSESFNPSVVSNGLCTYLLSRAAHRDGVKVVLTGEGADELFCGYHRFSSHDPWRQTRAKLIDDMHATELRRLDTCCMAHAVEARCPFLDRAVRSCSDGLDYTDLYMPAQAGLQNKMALRRAFENVLPTEVLNRRKTSFDVGSGVRGLVVSHLRRNGSSERKELERIWRRNFTMDAADPWFQAYPVFDQVIDKRRANHR